MSSIHGKKDTVFRKKKTSTKLSSSPTFTQDYKFAHQTSAGETVINLDSLVLPTQMTEFINPTGTELAKINLKSNQNSLVLVSSIGKTLICDVDYKINTSRIIELQYEASENEIFTGQMRATQATNNILDGETYTCTGTLLAGQQNIALGKAFTLNANPSTQIGDMVLYIDGVQQFRNVDNVTATPLADGNYEELDAGAGLTNALKVNDVFATDVAWAVVSTGVIVDNSNIGNQQQLDALAGQIDSLVPTVASLAGVPETTFQAGPNSVDLKAFGDKLFTACATIDSLTTSLNSVLNAEVQTPDGDTVTKILSSSVTALADVSDLTFTGLEVGARYEIKGRLNLDTGAGGTPVVDFHAGASGTGEVYGRTITSLGAGLAVGYGVGLEFTASSSEFYTYKSSSQGTLSGTGTKTNTFLQLKKLGEKKKISDLI